jgi:hypothetical protein
VAGDIPGRCQVRACLANGGLNLGRLYPKIADALGPQGLEEVKRLAKTVGR